MTLNEPQIDHECVGESLVNNPFSNPIAETCNFGSVSGIRKHLAVTIAFLTLLITGGGATAMAQCGNSLNEMAAAAAAARQEAPRVHVAPNQNQAAVSSSAVNPSIVGLWHIRFMIGDRTIQEAFQIWNEGGTEVHNPNVDPRSGNVCLGTWAKLPRQAFKLNHRVWNYDINGNYMGTIHLAETVSLSGDGGAHIGTFSLAFYDPSGSFLFEVPWDVVAERITVDQP